MASYDLCITARGMQALGDLIASAQQHNETPVLQFSRVAFGKGVPPDGASPETLDSLVDYVADGTTTKPIVEVHRREDGSVEKTVVSFVVEYNPSKLNASEVTEGFWLSEFAAMSFDAKTGEEFAFVRGDLNGCPMYVTPFTQETGAIDVRQFLVSIAITRELNITLGFVPLAWLTAQEMYEYAEKVCKPAFLALAQDYVDNIHDKNPEAHDPLRGRIKTNEEDITMLKKVFGGQGSTSFLFNFTDVLGVPDVRWNLVQGVWNHPEARIEY
jgi:hypothetical protein